jgi:hypothetical protein
MAVNPNSGNVGKGSRDSGMHSYLAGSRPSLGARIRMRPESQTEAHVRTEYRDVARAGPPIVLPHEI